MTTFLTDALPAKDLSELHCDEDERAFDAAINVAFNQAKPAEQTIEEQPQTDTAAMSKTRRILQCNDLKPLTR